jgi:cyclic pyranopterin phosphate synthase
MPEEGVAFHDKHDLLSAEQIIAIAKAAAKVGVTHFKLTGGEPTVRADLLDIVRGIAALKPTDLSLTTNGILLEKLAQPLRDAGLNRITVSCDSLKPVRFASIVGATRTLGNVALDRVLAGLDAAVNAGFDRIKINMVVMRGVNDDEVGDFARLAIDRPWTIRFIEYMPLGESRLTDDPTAFIIDNDTLRARIATELGPLTPIERADEKGVGPAVVFRTPGARGRLGFISAMSKPFCETCNRLRLTATGELRSCLFDGGEVSVLPALFPTPDDDAIADAMRRCVVLKPETHSNRGNRAMSQLGG